MDWFLTNQIVCQNINKLNLKQIRNLDFNPELLIQFRMYFYPKSLKRERKIHYLIFYCGHSACQKIRSVFRVLGIYTLVQGKNAFSYCSKENKNSYYSNGKIERILFLCLISALKVEFCCFI